jgi:hypothetical protein
MFEDTCVNDINNVVVNISLTLNGGVIVTDADGNVLEPRPADEVLTTDAHTVFFPKTFTVLRTQGSPLKVFIAVDNSVICAQFDVDDGGNIIGGPYACA